MLNGTSVHLTFNTQHLTFLVFYAGTDRKARPRGRPLGPGGHVHQCRGGQRRLETGLPDKDEAAGKPDKGLSARGLGSRLELLLPHMAHSEDYLQLHETAQLADNIAQKLAGLYPLAVKRLEAPSEPR